MQERIAQTIRNCTTIEQLSQLEQNARKKGGLDENVREAIRARSTELARSLVAETTGLDLTTLSAAEEKIVRAVSEYVGIKKRQGTNAQRTLNQLRNLGLIAAAEAAVCKSKPTKGFQTLADAKRAELSYENIVIQHPAEFSPRALWYSRRTLGLPNSSVRPPARSVTTKRSPNTRANSSSSQEVPYWVFVCNPKKWAIDRFLEQRIEHDSWGVRPCDRDRFAAGQLGIVRVGIDSRSAKQRQGRERLKPGIYALCEVESTAFLGTGAADEFWARGEERNPGWPTVGIRYLRVYRHNALTIERMRIEKPNLSPFLLNGLQASSFPISAADFRDVLALLGETGDNLPGQVGPTDIRAAEITAMEQKYLLASPEVKERLSQSIERGPIGAMLKRTTGFRCQVCVALGLHPFGFCKPNGEPYVEAHHVMPVSQREIGSLASSNVMIVCANHHRQLHYGDVGVTISQRTFDVTIDGASLSIPRLSIIPAHAIAAATI